MWKCYHCEKEIAPRAPTCPHCGGTFNAYSRGYMSSNARAHENYRREKQGLPPKSGLGCSIFAALFLGAGIYLVQSPLAHSATLTHDEAHDIIHKHYKSQGRCVDLMAYTAGDFNDRPSKEIDRVCFGKDYDIVTSQSQSCFKTRKASNNPNYMFNLLGRLQDDKIIQRMGEVRGYVYFNMKGTFGNRYFTNKGRSGALCGPFPNTGFHINIKLIQPMTDRRFKVFFNYQQHASDPTFKPYLIKGQFNKAMFLTLENDTWTVTSN